MGEVSRRPKAYTIMRPQNRDNPDADRSAVRIPWIWSSFIVLRLAIRSNCLTLQKYVSSYTGDGSTVVFRLSQSVVVGSVSMLVQVGFAALCGCEKINK